MIVNVLDIFCNYAWNVALVQIASAIALFFIVNWIGEHSISIGYIQLSMITHEHDSLAFNLLFKVLSPVVFLVLYIVLFQSIGHEEYTRCCFMITIYYWVFRSIIIFSLGRTSLTNWWIQLFYWISSIILSFWIYSLMEKVGRFMPDPQSLIDQLWILIVLFLYSVFNKISIPFDGAIKRKEKYITRNFLKFKKQYDAIVSTNCANEFLEATTYSIMIYENFNRPAIIRKIESLCCKLTKKPHTLGIMQVTTSSPISDEQSILEAIGLIQNAAIELKKIVIEAEKEMEEEKDYDNNKLKSYYYRDPMTQTVLEIAETYNGGDPDYEYEIGAIFEIISKKYPCIQQHYDNLPVNSQTIILDQ